MTSETEIARLAVEWFVAYRFAGPDRPFETRQARDKAAADAEAAFFAELTRLTADLERIKVLLADPVAVRVNLLRGTIAKPDDLIFMHDTDGPYARLTAALAAREDEVRQAVIEECANVAANCTICRPNFGTRDVIALQIRALAARPTPADSGEG